MIRLPVVARLLGSVALIGLVGCSAEHGTSNDPSGQNAPEGTGTEATVETTTDVAVATPNTPNAPPATNIGSLDHAMSASFSASVDVKVDVATTPPPPAPPAPPAPATCTSNGISGNGSITVTNHSVSSFLKVDSKLAGNVVIQEGKWFGVQVETDANVQANIKAEVDANGVLVIEGQGEFCANKLQVVVTLPTIKSITLEASGSVEIKKTGLPSDVDIVLKGSGSIKFDGKALALDTKLEGDGTIVLASGSAVSTNIEIDGTGTIDASNFGIGTLTKKISVGGSFKFSL